MDSPADSDAADGDVAGTGVDVRHEPGLHVASLRYFDATGAFVRSLDALLGGPLPAPLQALLRPQPAAEATDPERPAPDLILAWRSPSETLLITGDGSAAVALQCAGRMDGCLVDQTGGISVLRVSGERAVDLLLRLGSTEAVPPLGAAHTGRLAEVAVMSLCVRPGQFMLLVERVYRRHLLGWIRATVADF